MTVEDPAGPPAERLPRRRRILVVDDDPDSADLLKVILEKLGFEAFAEHDGQRAVDTARQCKAEVVLCDLGLPGIDSFEIATRMRAEEALTAALAPHATPEGVRMGAACWVVTATR